MRLHDCTIIRENNENESRIVHFNFVTTALFLFVYAYFVWYIPFSSHVKFLIIFHRCFPILLARNITFIRFEKEIKRKRVSRNRRFMKCVTSAYVWFHCTSNMRIKELIEFVLLKIVSLYLTLNRHIFLIFAYSTHILILDISFTKSKNMNKNTNDWYIYAEMWISRFSGGTFRLENQNSMYGQMKRQKYIVLIKYLIFFWNYEILSILIIHFFITLM